MSEHTPGPWEYFITDHERKQFRIADADTAQRTIGFAYKVDNARLIAAAPELLEALKLADLLLSGANMNSRVVERNVRAAIAKATGESQ